MSSCCARRRRTPAGRGVSSCWDGRGRGQLLIAAPPATSQTGRLGGSPRRWMGHARRSTARHVAFWKVAGSWRFPRSVCPGDRTGHRGWSGVVGSWPTRWDSFLTHADRFLFKYYQQRRRKRQTAALRVHLAGLGRPGSGRARTSMLRQGLPALP
jgi:hypothetical protein